MQCTNWPIANVVATLGVIATLGAGTNADSVAAAARHSLYIDDAITGKALLGRFDYVGHWQHVAGKHDGRSNGTSTRSTRTGDVAILSFSGTRVRLYGVRGPSGGRGGISLDESSTGGHPVDFYAPRLVTNALMYQSPVLAAGVHTVTIVVWGTRSARARYYYVNVDGAEVDN